MRIHAFLFSSRTFFLFALIGFLTAPRVLLAAGESADTVATSQALTPQELVKIGLSRSRELSALTYEQKAKSELQNASRLWSNPSLDLGYDQKVKPGGDTRGWRIGVSQPLPVPGLLSLKSGMAQLEVDQAEAQLLAGKVELSHRLYKMIYELRALEERSSHAEERLRRFRLINAYLKSRTFASPQKRAEASIVGGKIQILLRDFVKLASRRESAWEELNLFLGLPERPQVVTGWYESGPPYSLAEFQEKVLQNNPALKAERLRAQTLAKQIEFNQRDRFSGLAVSLGYGDSQGYDPERVYSLGASIPLPFLNSGSADIEASKLLRTAGTSRFAFASEQINFSTRLRLREYETALSTLKALPMKALDRSENEMKFTDAGFRRGQIDLLTYIEADAEHSEILEASLEAQMDFVEKLSNVLDLTAETHLPAPKDINGNKIGPKIGPKIGNETERDSL